MDLKELYESMLASKHLRRTKRLKIDQKYYAITYEIHHKHLTITKIKRLWFNKYGKQLFFKKSHSPSLVMLYRRKNFHLSQSSRGSSPHVQTRLIRNEMPGKSLLKPPTGAPPKVRTCSRQTQTDVMDNLSHDSFTCDGSDITIQCQQLAKPKKCKRKSTQTLIKYFKSQQTATDELITNSKAEQTAIDTHAMCCQTDMQQQIRTQEVGIDVKPATQNSANQTHIYYYGIGTQTAPNDQTVTTQTDLSNADDRTANYCETIIMLLNEIGEALLLQNEHFEHIHRSVVQLFDWTCCINKLLIIRRHNCNRRQRKPSENTESDGHGQLQVAQPQ